MQTVLEVENLNPLVSAQFCNLLPRPPSCIKGGLLLREGKGGRGNGREGKGKGGGEGVKGERGREFGIHHF